MARVLVHDTLFSDDTFDYGPKRLLTLILNLLIFLRCARLNRYEVSGPQRHL
jgi:hypothetical protein